MAVLQNSVGSGPTVWVQVQNKGITLPLKGNPNVGI